MLSITLEDARKIFDEREDWETLEALEEMSKENKQISLEKILDSLGIYPTLDCAKLSPRAPYWKELAVEIVNELAPRKLLDPRSAALLEATLAFAKGSISEQDFESAKLLGNSATKDAQTVCESIDSLVDVDIPSVKNLVKKLGSSGKWQLAAEMSELIESIAADDLGSRLANLVCDLEMVVTIRDPNGEHDFSTKLGNKFYSDVRKIIRKSLPS